jgi:hypothetical protein
MPKNNPSQKGKKTFVGFSAVPMCGCDARFDTWQNTGAGILSVGHFVAWAFSIVVPNDHVIPLPRVLVKSFSFLFSFLNFNIFNKKNFKLRGRGALFSVRFDCVKISAWDFFFFNFFFFMGGQVYCLVLGLIVRRSLHERICRQKEKVQI